MWFASGHTFDVPCKSINAIKPGDGNRFKEANPK